MSPLDAVWPYALVFGLLIAAGVGAPIPEEIPIITAGILVSRAASTDAPLYWGIMLPLCMLGVVIADVGLYFLGRYYAVHFLEKRWFQKLLPPDKQAKIEHSFQRYGTGILFIARLVPGIRTPIFMMAGMIRFPWYRFLIADGLYAIPGVTLLFFSAYWFTGSFQRSFERFMAYRFFVVGGVIVLATLFFAVRYGMRRRARAAHATLPFPTSEKGARRPAA